MSYKVYLCGPITGKLYNDTMEWRQYVSDRVIDTVIPLSPMRGKSYLEGVTPIGDTYENTLMSSARGITTRDRFDTLRCDLLFANLLGAERVSIGSMIELGWADSRRTPIIVVMEKDNIHQHGMVREIANWVVPTIDEGIEVVNKIFAEGV